MNNISKQSAFSAGSVLRGKRMRYIFLLLFFVTVSQSSVWDLAAQTIKPVSANRISVEKVLNKIEQNSDYVFLFNDKTINTERVISFKNTNGNLKEILTSIFAGTNVSWQIVDKQIILSKKKERKTIEFNGRVIDSNNEPIYGVSVIVNNNESKNSSGKGSDNDSQSKKNVSKRIGVTTNIDGKFTIKVHRGDKLEFSFIGFETKYVVATTSNPIEVVLQEDTEILNSVVVTALGIKREEKTLSYNVQELKGNALTEVKDANLINSLDGKVAGVTINRSGSGIGGATRVVMRGAKSIEGSNSVLYVIDGIPIFNTSVGQDSGVLGESRVASEGIADFNPEDVESISVLSGPSAAALYGSSAANGVIMITTKKGKAGKAKVDLSTSFEFTRPFITPKFQNTYGNKPGAFESWGDKLEKPASYDPRNDFFRTGMNIINSATLTFGNEKNQTYLSIGTTNADGIVPNNNYERYNFNITNTMNLLNDKLNLTIGAQYIKQKDRNMVSQGRYWNPIVSAYLFPRGEAWEPIKTFERFDITRNIPVQYWPVSEGSFGVQNPYWTAYRNVADNNKDRYIFTTNATYTIFDWLNVSGRLRMDKSHTYFHRDLYATTSELWAEPKGNFEYSNNDDRQLYGDFMVNLDRKFGDYSLRGNFGTSFSDFRARLSGFGGPLQLVPNMFTIGNINPMKGSPLEGGGQDRVRNVAVFGSIEAGWKNMVFLSITGRNDWNSRLVNSAEPSFFYPSIGLSGLISEMVDMGSFVDLLKLRVSYTEVGAPVSRIGMTPGTYSDVIIGGTIQPNTIYPYGDFKAERTKSYEFGLNFKGLKGLSFDITLYKSNTFNQTFLGTMPESSGYEHAYLQAGNVENRGIEAALGYDYTSKEINYSTNIVFSRNKNEIKEMVKDYKHPLLPNKFDISEVSKDKGRTILKVGGSINDIYANQFIAKDGNGYAYVPETGEIRMETLSTPVYLGHTTPDFNMGWSNNLSWRGLNLGFIINGRFGGVVTSSTEAVLDRFGVSQASADARNNGGVMIPNQGKYDAKKYYALVGASGESSLMGYYTYSATNIRLQQITLSYNLPSKWFDGMIRGLKISLIGNNLLMIYNKAPFDPEVTPTTGTYGIGNDFFMQPSLRSFGASVKLSL